MEICNLRVEHHRQALGIGEPCPRLSWSFAGSDTDWFQESYEIEVKRPFDGSTELTQRTSTQSLYLSWPSKALRSSEIVELRVRARSSKHHWTQWSEPLHVEAGLLNPEDWVCSLIQHPVTSKTSPSPGLSFSGKVLKSNDDLAQHGSISPLKASMKLLLMA